MQIKRFEDFIGNDEAIDKISLKIKATNKKKSTFPHFGFFSEAGMGKTTLAELTAKELDAGFVYISSTAISNPLMFRQQIAEATEIVNEKGRAIIMLDECHALNRRIQDNLLSLLEHPAVLCTSGFRYDEEKQKIVKDQYGTLKEELPEGISFCLATTHPGDLSDALLSRLFKIKLKKYSNDELSRIAKNLIGEISNEHAARIGSFSRSARDVVKICEHLKDICLVEDKAIDNEVIDKAIHFHGYENLGLSYDEIRYVKYLKTIGASSLSNISSYLNVSSKEVEEKIETFLIRKGYIFKDTRGRKLTKRGKALTKRLDEKDEKTKKEVA